MFQSLVFQMQSCDPHVFKNISKRRTRRQGRGDIALSEVEVQMSGTLLSMRQWAGQELMESTRGDTNRDICCRLSSRDKVVDKAFFRQSEETSGSWSLVL